MDLGLLIDEKVEKLTPNIFSKIKKWNYKFINQNLKQEAEDHYKKIISKNDDTINDFWAGIQWPTDESTSANYLAYNTSGKMVWDLKNTYPQFEVNPDKPKRVVNLIKTKLRTIIANHAEVDPFPVAVSPSDWNGKKEQEKKINLILETGFKIENDIDEIYEVLLEDAYKYPVSYLQVIIDKDKSETQIPIKIRVVPHEDIRYDPQAEKLDLADYMYHKTKMRYWDFLTNYDYTHTDLSQNEPEKEQMIEVDIWYFRTKDKDNKTIWFKKYMYNEKWVDIKIKGQAASETQILQDMIYEKLPYELARTKIEKEANGESSVIDLLDTQVQYNKVMTEQDWNMNKSMDSPIISTLEKKDLEDGLKPGGFIHKGPNDLVENLKQTNVPISEFEAWKASLSSDMDKYLGNIDTLEGRGVSGYASAKLLQTKMQAVQSKLKIAEKHLMKSLENITYKYLYLFIKYLGNNSIYLWDSEIQKNIEITKKDLQNMMYRIKIDIKDSNLMSRESKWEILTQFMQYSQGNPIIMYLMALTAQNGMPGIFPQKVMDSFEILYNNEIEKLALPQPEQVVNNEEQPIEEDITIDQFESEIEAIRQEMRNSGVPEQSIQDIDEVVIEGNTDRELPYRDVLYIYKEEANKRIGMIQQSNI